MSTSDLIQLAGVIGSLLGVIVGAGLWFLKTHLKKIHRETRTLTIKNASLEDGAKQLQAEKTRLETECSHQRRDAKKLSDERDDSRRQFQQASDNVDRLRVENAELKAECAVWKERLAPFITKLAQLEAENRAATQERGNLRDERDQLRRQLHEAQAELTAAKPQLERLTERASRGEERAKELEHQLERRITEYEQVTADRSRKIRQLEAHLQDKSDQLAEERDRAEQAERDAMELNKQIDQIIKQEERVWERPVAGVPFQPLPARRVPIIAVLNLKGGVGKTTITANLAGTMAQQGKKALVIDADYQRNLSMLLVPDKDRTMLHLQQRTLQHFLAGSDHSLAYLLHAACEVPGCSNYWVVTNSDPGRPQPGTLLAAYDGTSLEDVEMRLMAEWMLRPTVADARLALREALHNEQLQQRGFHYVLIDCPPRVSTACINALAACDFFLVPVLLDAIAARAVPNLLRTLRRLRSEARFPHLRCLGVVANEVKIVGGKLVKHFAETWAELPAVYPHAWGSDVHLFETMIPHSPRFADAAGSVFGQDGGSGLALRDQRIQEVFTDLLQEVEARVEHESKHLATVPS